MTLPKIATPTHTLKLPSDGRSIRYRPFLVKEEKILLMAMESEDEKEVTEAVKNIIENCVEDDLDVKNLAVFDVEYLFLNLRSKSIGESVKLKMSCEHCENECMVNVNLSSVEINRTEGHDNKIQLTSEIGVIMRYPTFGIAESVDITKDPLKVVNDCVDKIYDSKKVYNTRDSSEEELTEFVDSLNHEQFQKIQNFFETMPKLKKDVSFKCSKCKKDSDIVIERLQDFFE